MGNLSEADRAKLQNMTDEERRAFFEERMGAGAPGADGANGGPGRGMGAMMIDGEVVSAASDSLSIKTSDGGSRTVYIDAKTVTGFASGSKKSLAAGDKVIVFARPEADNVIAATAVVVR